MTFATRLYLQVGEFFGDWLAARMQWTDRKAWLWNGIIQSVVIVLPLLVPNGGADLCKHSNSDALSAFLTLIFRYDGAGHCPIFLRWFTIYMMCYVWSFHFIRPAVDAARKHLPSGPTWAALALSASMVLGVAAAMIHYPFESVDAGVHMEWLPYEVAVGFIQPMLFALAMTQFPYDLAFWGNTSLGCYVFHFYIRHRMTTLIWSMVPFFAFDKTGILIFAAILIVCIIVQSTLGPIGHYFLVGLQYLPGWIARILRRGFARQPQPSQGKAAPAAIQP